MSSECIYRAEEMELIAFTPVECIKHENLHCDKLVSYARFQRKSQRQDEAQAQFIITLFTCIVLTAASLKFGSDIEEIVIIPIKKIVDII